MEEQILTKEVARELMAIKGEVRGLALKSHGQFIIKEEGENSLQKLEEEMVKSGYPLNHKNIESMKFYPIGLEAVELLAIKKLFNFNEEKFKELGAFGSKTSLIMKIFMKYFASLKLTAKQSPEMWKKYYTVGNLELVELAEAKRYLILRLKDFSLHPLHCLHLQGYFSSVVKMVVKNSVISEETKCVFKGDNCHQFLLKW